MNLSETDKKRLEIKTDSVTSYMSNTKTFGGQANVLPISKLPGNEVCADCDDNDNDWVNVAVGVFICINCVKVHKIIWEEIGKVKSMKHDGSAWGLDEIQLLGSCGNIKINSAYLDRLPSYYLIPSELKESSSIIRDPYIREKYQKKAFLKDEIGVGYQPNTKAHPYYEMPQEQILMKVDYRLEKDKKFKSLEMHHVSSYLFLLKSLKDQKPKVTIDLANTKIRLVKITVKEISSYTIEIEEASGKKHFVNPTDASRLIDIIHSFRRASIFYAKGDMKIVENPIKDIKFEQSKVEMSELKGNVKISGSKKYTALVDNMLFYFKSEKKLTSEGTIILKEAEIEKIEEKKNYTIKITSVFGIFLLKLADATEMAKWFDKLKEVIEKVTAKRDVNFKTDFVYIK